MSHASCPLDAGRPREPAAGLLVTLQSAAAPSRPAVALRAAALTDANALEALEMRAFTHERIARRSFVRFLTSPNASLIVAQGNDAICGYALVLFRARSQRARLYSIAIDAEHARRRIGACLLSAAEDAACARGSKAIGLEVSDGNAAARNLYEMFGYRLIEPLSAYYQDGSDAWRFQKLLGR